MVTQNPGGIQVRSDGWDFSDSAALVTLAVES